MVVDKENIAELILRMEIRNKLVWSKPSPYIKPLWESSEIKSKVKELQELIN